MSADVTGKTSHWKILVVSHLWPRRDFTHLGIFVADQVAELAKFFDLTVAAPVDLTIRGEEITLSETLKGLPRFRHRTHPDFIPHFGITPEAVSYRGDLFRQQRALKTAERLARRLQTWEANSFDLVHAHTVFPDGLACALWLQDKTIPLVVTAHGSDVHSMSAGVRTAFPHLLKRADMLFPVSRGLANTLQDLGADPAKLAVVPNGFSAELFTFPSLPVRHRNRLAYLGRLGVVKRVDLLIRALGYCPAEVTLDIAGDGPLRRQLEALVQTFGMQKRVRFLGTISRPEVPQFLAQAALMCLVSEREGWPTVIFESLACGTPVLATAVGGIPEALSDPRWGCLVPPDCTPKALGKAISQALAETWDHAAMRDHAQNYSWTAIGASLRAIYQSHIEKKQLVLDTM